MIIGIFTHFFAVETTLAERQFFRALAKLIGKRAARLSACGVAAIVSKMGYLDQGCSVGADGSLYNVSSFAKSPQTPLMFGRNIQGLRIECTKA
jgi:hexokinase